MTVVVEMIHEDPCGRGEVEVDGVDASGVWLHLIPVFRRDGALPELCELIPLPGRPTPRLPIRCGTEDP
jgi:hypothetical protein